ncbi:MAG: hypothetical protein MK008_09740 [Bdellovibrionales bacterium]|nr:hypothetical protein [Bdellovibrionales bacterium]
MLKTLLVTFLLVIPLVSYSKTIKDIEKRTVDESIKLYESITSSKNYSNGVFIMICENDDKSKVVSLQNNLSATECNKLKNHNDKVLKGCKRICSDSKILLSDVNHYTNKKKLDYIYNITFTENGSMVYIPRAYSNNRKKKEKEMCDFNKMKFELAGMKSECI